MRNTLQKEEVNLTILWYSFSKMQKGKSNYSLKVISILTLACLDVGAKKKQNILLILIVSFRDCKQM